MPLIKAVIGKVSDAISFFLVCLIGRSLGLIYTGIRQSLQWKWYKMVHFCCLSQFLVCLIGRSLLFILFLPWHFDLDSFRSINVWTILRLPSYALIDKCQNLNQFWGFHNFWYNNWMDPVPMWIFEKFKIVVTNTSCMQGSMKVSLVCFPLHYACPAASFFCPI